MDTPTPRGRTLIMADNITDKSRGKVPYILNSSAGAQLSDGTHQLDEGDDLIPEVKETLRDHLKAILTDSSNAYKPKDDFDVPYETARGGVAPGDNFTPAFVVGDPSAGIEAFASKETLATFSTRIPSFHEADPTDIPPGDPFDAVINKTTKSKKPSQLLSGIVSTDDTSAYGTKSVPNAGDATVLQQKISSILTNNRFSPGDDSPYIQDDNYSDGVVTVQKLLGKYTPRGSDAPVVTFDQLKEIGRRMVIAATGEDPDASKNEGIFNLTNTVQLGFSKQSMASLLARQAMKDMGIFGELDEMFLEVPDTTLRQAGDDEFGDAVQSYGQLNSPNEPFDSVLPFGMAVLAAETMIVMLVLSFIFSLLPSGTQRELPNPRTPNNLIFGRFLEQGARDNLLMDMILRKILRIPRLRNGFDECFNRGIQLFYGINGDLTDVDTYLEAGAAILEAPGYYATVMRRVAQDFEQVNQAMGEMVEAFQDNPLDAISSLVKVFQAFASSATWRFMVTMLVTGDIGLVHEGGYTYFDQTTPSLANLSDSPTHRGATSRGAAGQMTWRHGSANALYLLPKSLGIAGETFSNSPSSRRVMLQRERRTLQMTPDDASPGRLSNELVSVVEENLDSEYVPFYFHDLRTNEIISFHAFLSSLNETISPSYNSSEAMGRVEPVRTYSGTTRALSLSFFVAATNEHSHERMWYDLNRLGAMLYPQFSRGTMVVNPSKQKFRMPFSQVQTASPLIRMRIGDLVSANGSRFGLARLFGIGEKTFGESFTKGADRLKDVLKNYDEIQEAIAEMIRKDQKRATQQAIASVAGAKKWMEMISKGEATPNIVGAFKGQPAIAMDGGQDEMIFRAGDIVKAQGTIENLDIKWIGSKGTWDDAGDQDESNSKDVGLALGPGTQFQIIPDPSAGGGLGALIAAFFTATSNQEDKKSVMNNSGYRPYNSKYNKKKSWMIRSCQIYQAKLLHADQYLPHAGLPTGMDFNAQNKFKLCVVVGSEGDLAGELSNFALDVEAMTVVDRHGDWGKTASYHAQAMEDIAKVTGLPDLKDPPANQKFFAAGEDGNPVIRSFLAAAGKGLAGFITNMSLDYSESTWETNRSSGMPRQRAPIFVRVDINFDVVHDIVPGLDADGAMRAPIWPVGNASSADWLEGAGPTRRAVYLPRPSMEDGKIEGK